MVVCFLTILVVVGSMVYVLATLHVRHKLVNGKLMAAWHIPLPGWCTMHYPERVVELKDWVGSKMEKITAAMDGKENPEIDAAIALKATGLYSDYELQQRDGHWILYRPERTKKFFSLEAYYRVSGYFADAVTESYKD